MIWTEVLVHLIGPSMEHELANTVQDGIPVGGCGDIFGAYHGIVFCTVHPVDSWLDVCVVRSGFSAQVICMWYFFVSTADNSITVSTQHQAPSTKSLGSIRSKMTLIAK